MNSKIIATLAVVMLCFAGVGLIDDGTDADDAKYLTILYDGIVDPADVATMGVTPASANYLADLEVEPETYKEGLMFDLIKQFLVGDKFIVPMATAATWTGADKTNILAAFDYFAGPIATEIKFTASANKLVPLANLDDVAKEVETAIALISATYDLQIEGLNATITEQSALIADLQAQLAQATENPGDAQTWQIVSIVLGALFILTAIFGGRAIVLIKKSGGRLF